MKHLIITFSLLMLALTGCKQDVNFGAAENTELDLGGGTGPTPIQGPVVKIVREPSDHHYGENTQVIFEVVAGDNEIEAVQCYIDNFEINCDWLSGVLELVDMPLGKHGVKIVAQDTEGLKGEANEDWSVYLDFFQKVENLDVRGGDKKMDILFVIDNSSSMRYEQTQISERFNKFMDQVKDLDWHIGLTTTDTRQSRPWSDGSLDLFPNGDDFLTPALGVQQAQELFSAHVHRKESGSDIERGIKAVYRSVERSVTSSTGQGRALRRFFRPDAALAVVVVSDEDESGDDVKSDGKELIKLIKDTWGDKKVFQWNSIIVHTQQCLNDTGHTMGYKYEDLSRRTNGMVGDVCAKNYSSLLKDLGKGVASLVKSYNLKCEPQDIDNDGKVDIKVISKNGKKVPGYSIDKTFITFDKALEVGGYKIEYHCLK